MSPILIKEILPGPNKSQEEIIGTIKGGRGHEKDETSQELNNLNA